MRIFNFFHTGTTTLSRNEAYKNQNNFDLIYLLLHAMA